MNPPENEEKEVHPLVRLEMRMDALVARVAELEFLVERLTSHDPGRTPEQMVHE